MLQLHRLMHQICAVGRKAIINLAEELFIIMSCSRLAGSFHVLARGCETTRTKVCFMFCCSSHPRRTTLINDPFERRGTYHLQTQVLQSASCILCNTSELKKTKLANIVPSGRTDHCFSRSSTRMRLSPKSDHFPKYCWNARPDFQKVLCYLTKFLAHTDISEIQFKTD